MKHVIGKKTDDWYLAPHNHDTIVEAKECEARHHEEYEGHLQAKAEAEAEARNERWFEERGANEPEDPREVEAQMRDDELRMKAEYAAREQEQEHAAYRRKMQRDEEMAAAQALDLLEGQPSGFNPDPPSDAQVRYALDLLGKKVWPQTFDEADLRNMARRQVSKLLDGLKSAAWKPRETTNLNGEELSAGMYRLESGTIVRVYLGQKSGKLLAKQLVFKEVRQSTTDDLLKGLPESWEKWGYQYLGLASIHVSGKYRRLTVEEAGEWGRKTRSCCVCSRRLDVPESVDAGIGPVCASRQGEWSA